MTGRARRQQRARARGKLSPVLDREMRATHIRMAYAGWDIERDHRNRLIARFQFGSKP